MSEQQGCEWLRLYRRIKTVLKRYGQENYWTADGSFHVADYHILDDNWGNLSHKVEIHNLQMLQPTVVKSLQSVLRDYPEWDIIVQVDVPGTEATWPPMGLVVCDDKIFDALEREHLPIEFQGLAYEGAVPFPSTNLSP
jgi:hypothetical protein